jgi:TonB family protein
MFLEIANHLWQSTLFAVGIALLSLLFRRDGAHVRYWLWWIASIKFLVPFSLLLAIGRALQLRATVPAVPESWSNTVTVVARPFAATWSPGAVLLALWLGGSLAILVTWFLRARRLRHLLREADTDSVPLVDGRRRIRIYRAEARIEPGVVGVLRTALLLPRGLEQRLSEAQMQAIIAHELCHIRRRDNLTAAAHMLVEAVFWFHPLVWWIGAKLIDERERACDEMVVTLGHDRTCYAEGILDVCEHFAASPLRCSAGISGSDLKRRVTQIMRYRGMNKLKRTKKLLLGIAALACLIVPIVAGLALQSPAVAQETAPPRMPSPPADGTPPDGEYLPIVKVAPIYPPRAVQGGIEGYVVVEYTVTRTGSTTDVVVKESSSALFDRAAIESAQKYEYQPRIIDGGPVEVSGVTTKIVFELAGGGPDEVPANPAPPAE